MTSTLPTPCNVDIEGALIGAILLANDAFRRVAQIVQPEHFAEPAHQQIWKVLAAMLMKGHPANPITLKTYLGDEDFGGITPVQYLANLVRTSTGVANVADYARMVRDLFLRRQIIALADRARTIAADAPVEATSEAIFADIERHLEGLRPAVQGEAAEFQDFDDISQDEIYEAHRDKKGFVGLSTGLPRLDEVLNGLQSSDLIILAGRPAMGKTSLATCISVAVARHVAVRRQEGENLGTVGFFSLEMSAKQLKQRIVSEFAGVSAQRLMSGNGANEDMEAFDRARRDLAGLPLTIDQTGELSIAQLKLKARALKKRRGLSLLVIDYLQLLSGSSRKDNRVAEVTEITVGLKALAKELDIPIIALSQLSRKVEEREDKRPLLSDLRESGSIEQDADSVIFVYREEYYLKNAKPRDEGEALGRWYGQMKRWEGVAEAIVAKNRHGRSDTVELGFQAEFTRFTNEPDWRSPDPDEARKAAKTVKLTSHGEALREILRELAPAIGDRPTVEDLAKKPGLPPNALLIPRDEVRKRFFESVVADLPEAEAAKKLQAASDNLRGHKMTVRFTNAAGVNVIYLVELIAE